MTMFQLATLLISIAALFGVINYHWLRLPASVAIAGLGTALCVVVMLVDALVPSIAIGPWVRERVVGGINFHGTVMEGMLAFLLFAGALHVDIREMSKQKVVIFALATMGVAISTLVVGVAIHLLLGVPLLLAFVFGALISPTDPVAVLAILKTAGVPKSVEAKIAGESLFNDGVGVVAFAMASAFAFGGPEGGLDFVGAITLFAREVLGAIVLGVLFGYGGYLIVRKIDDFETEVAVTVALAMGSYALAAALHSSGLLAAVVAGLLIGSKGIVHGMSEKTRDYTMKFWTVVDVLLNAVLFLLVGIEILAVTFTMETAIAAAVAVPVVLIGRLVSVTVPMTIVSIGRTFTPGLVRLMTWGGMRGGISLAMAMALPENDHKATILAMTWVVVMFSILIQGTTVSALVRRSLPPTDATDENANVHAH